MKDDYYGRLTHLKHSHTNTEQRLYSESEWRDR